MEMTYLAWYYIVPSSSSKPESRVEEYIIFVHVCPRTNFSSWRHKRLFNWTWEDSKVNERVFYNNKMEIGETNSVHRFGWGSFESKRESSYTCTLSRSHPFREPCCRLHNSSEQCYISRRFVLFSVCNSFDLFAPIAYIDTYWVTLKKW